MVVVRSMLIRYEKNPQTPTCGLAHIAKNKPELLLLFIRHYPAAVHFIPKNDLIGLHYLDKKASLLSILTITPIKDSRVLLLSSLASAQDYHLLRTIPLYTWMEFKFLSLLLNDAFGKRLVLKLIEITSQSIIADYYNTNKVLITPFIQKHKFGADILTALIQKTSAAQTRGERKHDTAISNDLLGLIEPITETDDRKSSINCLETLLRTPPEYTAELANLINNNTNPERTQKILLILKAIDFHAQASINPEPFMSLFMKLSTTKEGRQFISACFKHYANAWIGFTDDQMKTLFLPFKDSGENTVVTILFIHNVLIFDTIFQLYPFCRRVIRDEFLKISTHYFYDGWNTNIFIYIFCSIINVRENTAIDTHLSAMNESLDGCLSMVDLDFLKSSVPSIGKLTIFMLLAEASPDALDKFITIILKHDQRQATRLSLMNLLFETHAFSNNIPTTPFYYLIQSPYGISVLRKLLLNMQFTEVTMQKLIDTMTTIRKKTRYEDTKWNILAICSTLIQAIEFFIELLAEYPNLLALIPLNAWHAPIDENDKPTTQKNWVSLRAFSHSVEGIKFFDSHKALYDNFMPKERSRPINIIYKEFNDRKNTPTVSSNPATLHAQPQQSAPVIKIPQQKLRK